MQTNHWRRRLIRGLLLYVVTPYLAVLVLLAIFQRRLVFHPTVTGRLSADNIALPGVAIEDVEIPISPEIVLRGWRFLADYTTPENQRILVIYFPGNGGCRRGRIADGGDFTRLGCDVLLFDYRGYGDNPGSPSETAFAADAQRIWKFATDTLHFPAERIVLFGESMGGGVATRLAAELSQAGTPPAALVLNSTFASLVETAAWHYPMFPCRFLLWDRFPSVSRMPHVACPVLQFHGTDDSVVPYAQGRRLFAAAPLDNPTGIENRFVTIEGGQHNLISMDDMQSAVRELLAQLERTRDG